MKKDKSKRSSKYSLLKAIGIAFLIFAVLSWIIPAGTISNGTYTKNTDGTIPVGLFGLFSNPLYSFGIFAQYFLLLLSIGGLYGVLNKTGVYTKIVDNFGSCVEKHKKLWLIVITFLLALISSIVGNQIVLFILVPFFVAVLMKGGFNKVTSIAATAGAIIIGVAGSIFGNDVIYISFFKAKVFTGTITKVIYFVLITTLYVLFLLLQNKMLSKKEKKLDIKDLNIFKSEEIPLYEKNESNKSAVPLIIMSIILLLIVFIGCINWTYTFDVSFFTELDTKINDISWLPKVFGTLPVMGYFGNYDVAAVILIFTFIIKWLYSIKFDEFVDAFKDGMKQMITPAVYAILASTIFAVMVNSNTGANISTTISNSILGISDKFYVLTVTLLGFVGGFFFNDLAYLTNSIYSLLATYGSASVTIMGILLQTGYAIAMLCLPVSVVLIAALKYLNVSYKEWMKYIYKFLLAMFVLVIVFGLIALAL